MATLKPPPVQHRSSSSSPSPPKAPLKVDPTATIADTAVFQGTYPVTIGAGTVIHPRAKFYTYEGPITIGDGCVISEKVVIGVAPTRGSRSTTPDPTSTREIATHLSYFVTIGPQSTIYPGAHIHSAAVVEPLVTINRNADIGSHAKICSGCVVPERSSVAEWMVVWGSGVGQRRRRAREAKAPGPAIVVAAQVAQVPLPAPAPEGKLIEDARLMVLKKEREALARMIVPAGTGRKK
ncbi:hypothetical protein N7495_003555 [Penicillium taxi]|uniref:uncharacterized protein n=1 Tax=Penicillium taxi TaxID=168475 RepID=UPI002545AD97|nr:uncharacterized protein N7495_003555 [Penicillium taxi]KAJ5898811.1 hypothetical protein N7495_003555 [Penicillium taxi]